MKKVISMNFLNNPVGVLLRFHERQFAIIIGDITQMFHLVQVLSADRDALRFLWHVSKDSHIDTQNEPHLFGKTDSPCCSNLALRKTALANQQQFNENVVNTVLKRFYMDYYLDSFDDPQTAVKTITNAVTLLKLGGFDLGKFVSNRKFIS